ncbi:unnamed protein product [Gongylonema pulchrum]|uniref:Uncharacterized protein n=1 Tax=Gongylonema pulchrum TaxID=637853 RepID=A0A183EBP8_9BILA|nr:unnamed protein product [Gongylonema pulchrum]
MLVKANRHVHITIRASFVSEYTAVGLVSVVVGCDLATDKSSYASFCYADVAPLSSASILQIVPYCSAFPFGALSFVRLDSAFD